MKTTKEELQDNQVKITVTIDEADVDGKVKAVYKDFAHRYNFPGFRKGKAPHAVIDNALGKEAVLAAVTEELINGAYPEAIEETGIFPVGDPKFADDQIVEPGKAYEFSFTINVKPTYELTSYEPVAIEMPPSSVTDEEVEEQVENMRQHYSTYADAAANAKVKADGFADIAVKALDKDGNAIEMLESESRLYKLGSGMFSEAFDKEIVGMKKGEEKQFTLSIPADEQSVLLSAFAGTDVDFTVTCNAVKKLELPEVTDEWAKETMGFESVQEMRDNIREMLTNQKDNVMPRLKENNALMSLIERFEGEAPDALVEQAQTQLLQDFFTQLQQAGMSFDGYLAQAGIDSAQFKEDVKAQATDQVKQDLALDAWAAHKGMTATDEEVAEEFKKANVPDPEELMAEWRSQGRLYLIREGVLRQKAALDVVDTAVVTELDADAGKAEKSDKKASKQKKEAEKEEKAIEEAVTEELIEEASE